MGQSVNSRYKTLLTSDNLDILAFFQAQPACALLKAGVVIILG